MRRRSLIITGVATTLLGATVAVALASSYRSTPKATLPATTLGAANSATAGASSTTSGPAVYAADFDRDVDGWTEWWNAATLTISPDARTGPGALRVVAKSGQSTAVRQSDALVPGHRHRLSVWAKGTGGMSAQIIQFDKNWAPTDTITLPAAVLPDGQWFHYDFDFAVARTAVHANIAIAADGSTLDLDDLEVQDLGEMPRPKSTAAPDPTAGTWKLAWGDEFNGTSLDRTQWTPDDSPTDFNGELHCYTSRPENLAVGGGHLTITARREDALSCPGDTRFPQGRQYSSALVRSHSSLREGRVEVRAKVPAGQGLWPAIWLLPVDAARYKNGRNGEIDVAEVIGSSPDVLHASIHYDYTRRVDGVGRQTSSLTVPAPLDRDFHTYAIEWDRDRVRWFLDDRLYFESGADNRPWYPPPGAAWPAPFDQDFYVILNLAVGGSWPGSPDASTVVPAVMSVDYVRIYKRASS
jgi:beta-glucanase (GH16 family)